MFKTKTLPPIILNELAAIEADMARWSTLNLKMNAPMPPELKRRRDLMAALLDMFEVEGRKNPRYSTDGEPDIMRQYAKWMVGRAGRPRLVSRRPTLSEYDNRQNE